MFPQLLKPMYLLIILIPSLEYLLGRFDVFRNTLQEPPLAEVPSDGVDAAEHQEGEEAFS